MADSDDKIIKDAKEFLQRSIDAEKDNRDQGLDDLRFLAGDQWPDAMRRAREVEARPCLTINKLPAFLHQITNDQRQNRPSIKIHPVSDTDEDKAEVIQGMTRHIEYESNADTCYDTATYYAAAIGFGYFRLVTEYDKADSFDQVIRFKRIENPFTVYFDPDSCEADGSDAKRVLISEDINRKKFEEDYPDEDPPMQGDLPKGTGDRVWVSKDTIRVAEFYRCEYSKEKLHKLVDGRTVWDSNLQATDQIATKRDGKPATRSAERKRVCWYKLTSFSILDRTEIDCDWIPVFPVWGEEINVEGKTKRSGIIRFAKDPQRMYNFWSTSATEEVAMRPKTPYIGAEGQFEGFENQWKQSNTRTFAYLQYKPTTVDGQLAPPPQRQPMTDIPAGYITMSAHAADDIKATMGLFDASLGAQGNETSGRAILARQKEGDTGSFHFTDNLNRAIRHAGRCIISMIPFIYDTQRIARIMGDEQEIEAVPINTPLGMGEQPPEGFKGSVTQQEDETGAIQQVMNDLTIGTYDVTVTAGPSYTTKRQEAADAMVQMAQAYPQLMQIAGDKIIRNMDWPGAEEIADRIKRSIPPQLIGDEDKPKGQQSLPPEIQQQLAHADELIQGLGQQLQQAEQALNSKVQQAQLDAKTEVEVATIKANADIEAKERVAQIQAQSEAMRQGTEDVRNAQTDEQQGAASQQLAQIMEAVVSGQQQTQELLAILAGSATEQKPPREIRFIEENGQLVGAREV